MAKTDAPTGRVDKAAKVAPLIWSAPELAEMGKKQVEAIIDAQTEMFEALQEWHRDYFASTRSETILVSDIAAKLWPLDRSPRPVPLIRSGWGDGRPGSAKTANDCLPIVKSSWKPAAASLPTAGRFAAPRSFSGKT